MPAVLASLAVAALVYAPHNRAHLSRPTQKVEHATSASVRASALESAILSQINRVRLGHGLRALRVSVKLTAAANQHSASMAQKGYFSHDSANGTVFWRRIASYYGYHGYRQWAVGENLLWSSPDVSSAGAVHMWMTSPEHRANLLDRSWREIGLSAVHVASAPGVYHGDEVTIVTADFGVRH